MIDHRAKMINAHVDAETAQRRGRGAEQKFLEERPASFRTTAGFASTWRSTAELNTIKRSVPGTQKSPRHFALEAHSQTELYDAWKVVLCRNFAEVPPL